jgi:uncharacterized protein (DUF302 family)
MSLITRLSGFLLLFSGSVCAIASDSPFAVYESELPFEIVMQDLQTAIEGKGFYVNNIVHMDKMMERTGKDLGMDKQIYLRAESIEFCSAVLSRRMTEENPHRIVNCPFNISVYVLPSKPDTTYIVHRRVTMGDRSAVMEEVEQMLESLGNVGVKGLLESGMDEDF